MPPAADGGVVTSVSLLARQRAAAVCDEDHRRRMRDEGRTASRAHARSCVREGAHRSPPAACDERERCTRGRAFATTLTAAACATRASGRDAREAVRLP